MPGQPPLFSAIDQHRIPIEPLLRRVLERFEADPAFRADLDVRGFQPWPSPADEIDCPNPWFFPIAMNGCGSAYGLYVHPAAFVDGVAPWVYWEHEDDGIVSLAPNTDHFFRGLLTFEAGATRRPVEVTRLRAVLEELGMQGGEAPFDPFREDPGADWLPPAKGALRDLEAYMRLLDVNPDAAERGLLGLVQHAGDDGARRALSTLYRARGWKPPWSSPRAAWA